MQVFTPTLVCSPHWFLIPVENPMPPNITGGIAMSKQPTEPAIDKTCAPRGVRAARTRWKYACQIKLEQLFVTNH